MQLLRIWIYILTFAVSLIIVGVMDKKKAAILIGIILILSLIIWIILFIKNAT